MPSSSPRRWTLLVHGGAGILTRETVSAETDAAARAGLDAALSAGEAVLSGGGSHVLERTWRPDRWRHIP